MRSETIHPLCDISHARILRILLLVITGYLSFCFRFCFCFRFSFPLSLLRPAARAPPVGARGRVPFVFVQSGPELHRVYGEHHCIPVHGPVPRVEPIKLDVVRHAVNGDERFVLMVRADA